MGVKFYGLPKAEIQYAAAKLQLERGEPIHVAVYVLTPLFEFAKKFGIGFRDLTDLILNTTSGINPHFNPDPDHPTKECDECPPFRAEPPRS